MSLNEPQLYHRLFNIEDGHEVRTWIAGFCISAAVAFLVVGGLLTALHMVSARASASVAVAAQADASEQAGRQAAQAEQAPLAPPSPEAGKAAEQQALSARDANLAVDPARADWNYVGTDEKTLYLTIDDGPSSNTQAVLDILDRYGVKATFFVVGHNEEYFPLIAEAYRRGHTIGLHTYTHDYAQVYSSPDAFFADLDAIGQVVKDEIGYVPCFIRFPGGSSNEVSSEYCEGIMPVLVDEVLARGYQYYDWNLSVGDGDEHDAADIAEFGTEPIEDDNIVLLCHDAATKQTTVEALPSIIEHYQELGYTFKALNRDSWVCHHSIG